MDNICTNCGRFKKGTKVGSGFQPLFCECVKSTKLSNGIKDIETTALYRKGITIFGSADKFRKYLNTFDIFLNCKPIDLIKNGYIDVVEKKLQTILDTDKSKNI